MKFPNKEELRQIRERYPKGARVELVYMDDFQSPPVGTQGTVTGVDDLGNVLMRWDNGSSLSIILGLDEVKFVNGRE